MSAAAVWGANGSGQYGAGYSGGGLLHMPTKATHMAALLGGIDHIHTTYGVLYGLHQGKAGVCGGDVTGVTGTGVRRPRQIEPSLIPLDEPVVKITAAGARWLALLQSGKLGTCGSNVFGQLGNGTSGEGHEANGSPVPVYLDPPKPVKEVVAGAGTNALLFDDGTIATWGEGQTGALGYGVMREQTTPKEVPGLTGVEQLSLGGISSLTGHALALMSDGSVMAWGANGAGQCAQPLEASVKTNHGYVIAAPTRVPGLPRNIVAVAAGAVHSLALDANGGVWSWGGNGSGELGYEPSGPGISSAKPLLIASAIAAIDAGLRFSVLLKTDGTVVVFGDNLHGVLGAGERSEYSAQPHTIAGLTGVTQISAGEDSCACVLSGTVPGPCVELVPGKEPQPGTLRMVWHTGLKVKWAVGIRPQTPTSAEREEWSSVTEGIGAVAREHTFSGLASHAPYEVLLRGSGFGECILEGAAA